MSVEDTSVGMLTKEAEEFMALLLAAQRTKHKCRWCNYFKKIGNRIVKQYVSGDESNE